MSVGLLIITHNEIGASLLHTAQSMLGSCPLATQVLPVPYDAEPAQASIDAKRMANKIDVGDGVLVLTDMYGSTPSNIAVGLLQHHDTMSVVAGINLPMLVRVYNYPRLNLKELTRKALSGGNDGVFLCSAEAMN